MRKSPTTLFLGLFRPFSPIFQKMKIFPKNSALSLLCLYGPLTSCKISKKANDSIPRKLRYRLMHARTWIHRTHLVKNRGSNKKMCIHDYFIRNSLLWLEPGSSLKCSFVFYCFIKQCGIQILSLTCQPSCISRTIMHFDTMKIIEKQ